MAAISLAGSGSVPTRAVVVWAIPVSGINTRAVKRTATQQVNFIQVIYSPCWVDKHSLKFTNGVREESTGRQKALL